jgi:hypothetical protein
MSWQKFKAQKAVQLWSGVLSRRHGKNPFRYAERVYCLLISEEVHVLDGNTSYNPQSTVSMYHSECVNRNHAV